MKVLTLFSYLKLLLRDNFITYSLIQQLLKYHHELGSDIMVNWKNY